MVVKSSDAPLDLAVVSEDVSSTYVLSMLVFEEVLVPSLALVLDAPPSPIGGHDLFPSPGHVLSARGQLGTGSSKMNVGVSDPPGLHCSVSSRDWIAKVAKVEDGWTVVKRKNTRSSASPLDLNLRLCKGGSKSKGKS